ncbi:PepSY domain-containing protein [Neobacillus sp. GCM10023253]|uniref:PepSY domain-containing protein n=1 Tax=Neobacillus sp. GCM10023253 TaxID=3252644 RepID=UPI0036143414
MNFFSILLTGSLLTGGLGASAYALTNHQQTAAQTNETVKTISEIKAKEIALGASKGGLVTKCELDQDNGMTKYEITIIKQNEEFEVEVNAETGKVLKLEQELQDKAGDEDKAEHKNEAPLQGVTPTISLENAKKTALDIIKGSITKAELDDEDKSLVYEVEIKTADHQEAEVKVDAISGKVLSTEFSD